MPSSTSAERRLLGLGISLLAGAAVGAVWVAGRSRATEAPGEIKSLINWEHVRSIATAVNRDGGVPRPRVEQLTVYYSDLVERCVPLITEFTGQSVPRSLDTVYVFGRNEWVRANIDNFRTLFEPIEEINRRNGGVGQMLGGGVMSSINQAVLSTELGVLMGYLARRVLGQYDLALLGKEPVDAGKLYFVEPNIAGVQQRLEVPADDFRMWIALHETTHAFEFEANPWLQRRFNELLLRYFRLLEEDLTQFRRGIDAARLLIERARAGRAAGERWISVIMTAEQRQIFSELQAIMCILEGYSNYVMNGIGRQLLPSYDRITARVSERQKNRSLPEQIFIRLTGLDMKLEQYVLGERFIEAVVAARGRDFVARLWAGPQTMPTMEEIRAPDRWIARMQSGQVSAAS